MMTLYWLKSLHHTDTMIQWLSVGGIYIVTGIIFAETGLLIGFFLPGDSLLITAGVLTNPENPNHLTGVTTTQFAIALSIAAIVGDQVGYYLGRKTGELIYERKDGLIFKKKYVIRAKNFYERYGVIAIIACRFIPILRTFVPFIAGVAKMNYPRYLKWDIFGGLLWINSLLWLGYYLGQTAYADRLDKIIVLVIFVSVLPIFIGAIRKSLGRSKA
ncbi:MAG: VTT domain-containing protein [Bdellovibrionales bacterium]|nr:VTT domain-containing protein [Bdellovibrionales bacterium]